MNDSSSGNLTDIFAKDPELRQCFQWIHAKKFDLAEKKLSEKLESAKKQNDAEVCGILLSILGLLFKVKRDTKTAYKYYQQAEKFLPDDMTLKMISARLLVEEFQQFDTALRKIDKILQATTNDPVMQHHALALKAVASFSMGKRTQAESVFAEILRQDFAKLRSSANVDYKMCELFFKKNFQVAMCLDYLRRCLDLAVSLKEKTMIEVLQKLLQAFTKPQN